MGAHSYLSGTLVPITATPGPNSTFETWSGGVVGASNPLSIMMVRDMMVTASFEQSGYDVYLPLVIRQKSS